MFLSVIGKIKRQSYVKLTHMNAHLYICDYCRKEYVPTRRGVQRFCKASCRTRSHQVKNKLQLTSQSKKVVLKKKKKSKKSTSEKMSFAGVGNAAMGTFAVDAIGKILTKKENKPATKKDVEMLFQKLNCRYYRVINLSLNEYQQQPYFDLVTKSIIYK